MFLGSGELTIFEMNIILCSVCVVLNAILLIFNCQLFLKHKAYLERVSVCLECLLVLALVIFLVNLFFPLLIIFQIILVIEMGAFALTIYGFFEFLAFSGESRPQKEKILVGIYSSISYIVVAVLFCSNFKMEVIEGHLYLGLDLNVLIVALILFMLPIIHLGAIALKKFLKVYEEALRYPLIGFINALAFYLTSIYLVLDFIEIRLIVYFFLIGALVLGIILNRAYPNLLVEMAHKFAFKTLFIIRNNGQTIFSHEFAPIVPGIKEKDKISYLIGGFIYAISHGIKEVIRQEYDTSLRTMDFGTLKMLFYYGNQVFGILFSRETNTVIYDKLKNFIDKFEIAFPEIIENTTGANLLEVQSVDEKDQATVQEIKDLMKLFFKS
jgi:hypothetical protein